MADVGGPRLPPPLVDSSWPAGRGGCELAYPCDASRGRPGRCRGARHSLPDRRRQPPCTPPANWWPLARPRACARARTAVTCSGASACGTATVATHRRWRYGRVHGHLGLSHAMMLAMSSFPPPFPPVKNRPRGPRSPPYALLLSRSSELPPCCGRQRKPAAAMQCPLPPPLLPPSHPSQGVMPSRRPHLSTSSHPSRAFRLARRSLYARLPPAAAPHSRVSRGQPASRQACRLLPLPPIL